MVDISWSRRRGSPSDLETGSLAWLFRRASIHV